ncbi:MAG: hypothetical protein HY319_04340 [Armatimonadetes bacterium]|nr:hypothetical protein [Armatimonadota bacterium]
MKRRSGSSLMATLLLVTVLSMFALTLAAAGTSHLSLFNRLGNLQRAEALASSAVARAMERLVRTEGKYGSPGDPTRQEWIQVYAEGYPDGSVGLLTFDPDQASRIAVPHSTNNYGNEGVTSGWSGTPVPPDGIHLVGTGRCNGVTRSVEAVLHIPAYPYALASTGKVRSGGGLLVGSLHADELPDGQSGVPLETDPEDLRPGHLASNSTEETAVELSENTIITGNLVSAGGIRLQEGAVVQGEVAPFDRPAPIPDIDISRFDTAGKAGVQEIRGTREEPMLDPTVSGFLRSGQDLHVAGDLNLEGAQLFVKGDIHVKGGITGTGMIACTGRLTAEGAANLDASNRAVILTGGGLTLEGKGAGSSSLQGVVYTEGDLVANQVSIVGAFVSNGGELQLNGTSAVHSGEMTQVQFRVAKPPDTVRRTFRVSTISGDGVAQVEAGPFVPGQPFEPESWRVHDLTGHFQNALPKDQRGPWYFTSRDAAYARFKEVVDAKAAWYDTIPGREGAAATTRSFLGEFDPPSLFPEGGGANGWVPGYGAGAGESFTEVRFDLSEFIGFGDRMRVLLWKPL